METPANNDAAIQPGSDDEFALPSHLRGPWAAVPHGSALTQWICILCPGNMELGLV